MLRSTMNHFLCCEWALLKYACIECGSKERQRGKRWESDRYTWCGSNRKIWLRHSYIPYILQLTYFWRLNENFNFLIFFSLPLSLSTCFVCFIFVLWMLLFKNSNFCDCRLNHRAGYTCTTSKSLWRLPPIRKFAFYIITYVTLWFSREVISHCELRAAVFARHTDPTTEWWQGKTNLNSKRKLKTNEYFVLTASGRLSWNPVLIHMSDGPMMCMVCVCVWMGRHSTMRNILHWFNAFNFAWSYFFEMRRQKSPESSFEQFNLRCCRRRRCRCECVDSIVCRQPVCACCIHRVNMHEIEQTTEISKNFCYRISVMWWHCSTTAPTSIFS